MTISEETFNLILHILSKSIQYILWIWIFFGILKQSKKWKKSKKITIWCLWRLAMLCLFLSIYYQFKVDFFLHIYKKAPVRSFFNTIQFSLKYLPGSSESYAVDLHRKLILPFPDPPSPVEPWRQNLDCLTYHWLV